MKLKNNERLKFHQDLDFLFIQETGVIQYVYENSWSTRKMEYFIKTTAQKMALLG